LRDARLLPARAWAWRPRRRRSRGRCSWVAGTITSSDRVAIETPRGLVWFASRRSRRLPAGAWRRRGSRMSTAAGTGHAPSAVYEEPPEVEDPLRDLVAEPAPDLVASGQAHLLGNYRQAPIVLDRGRGCEVWDTTGRRYL